MKKKKDPDRFLPWQWAVFAIMCIATLLLKDWRGY